MSRILSILCAGLWGLAPWVPAFAAAPSQEATPKDEGYEYVVDAKDGTLYFAKVETKVAGTVVITMRIINDPDSDDKDYTLIRAFKCQERLVKENDGQWRPVAKGTVGDYMIAFGC